MIVNVNVENQPKILSTIGEYCAMTRIKKGIPQNTVAKEIGCTPQNISSFERGLNNSALILLWYIKHGLLETLEKWGEI